MPACFLRSRRRSLPSLRLRSAIELGASAQQPRSPTRCGDAASAAGRAAGWRRPVDRRTGSLGASWPRPGAHSRRGFGLHAASHCTRLRITQASRLASDYTAVKSSESNLPPAKSPTGGGVRILMRKPKCKIAISLTRQRPRFVSAPHAGRVGMCQCRRAQDYRFSCR